MVPYNGESCNSLDPWVNEAIHEIRNFHGKEVALKGKSLLKFGRNDALGTSSETVWSRGGNETYATTNAIDKISSSDNSDTVSMKVEGHTIDSDGNFHFVVQSVTLVGQTETALTTPLARASRVYNDSGTNLAGTVYVYEDDTVTAGVPQTAAKIHLQTLGEQSHKCATTVSNEDFWLIHHAYFTVKKKTSAQVDFSLEIADKGKVFRPRTLGSASTTGFNSFITFEPMIIVPSNADVRVTALASTTNVSVDAWLNGPLCIVKRSL